MQNLFMIYNLFLGHFSLFVVKLNYMVSNTLTVFLYIFVSVHTLSYEKQSIYSQNMSEMLYIA